MSLFPQHMGMCTCPFPHYMGMWGGAAKCAPDPMTPMCVRACVRPCVCVRAVCTCACMCLCVHARVRAWAHAFVLPRWTKHRTQEIVSLFSAISNCCVPHATDELVSGLERQSFATFTEIFRLESSIESQAVLYHVLRFFQITIPTLPCFWEVAQHANNLHLLQQHSPR